MIRSFFMNGYRWRVIFVKPGSEKLIDRTGRRTVATTDPSTGYIYLSAGLSGDFLTHVLIHELGHCAIVSFGLLPDIHRMVKPAYWIDAEEWICNFIADYGMRIFSTARTVLGDQAIACVPVEIERMMA